MRSWHEEEAQFSYFLDAFQGKQPTKLDLQVLPYLKTFFHVKKTADKSLSLKLKKENFQENFKKFIAQIQKTHEKFLNSLAKVQPSSTLSLNKNLFLFQKTVIFKFEEEGITFSLGDELVPKSVVVLNMNLKHL